jgi:hypothetical protein
MTEQPKPKFPTNHDTAVRLMSIYSPSPERMEKIDAIRVVLYKAACEVAGLMPEGADAVVALRKLQEAQAACVLAVVADPRPFSAG